ncbi:hypothetical protein SALBM217S_05604 [Streptomyces griseoloalbus]
MDISDCEGATGNARPMDERSDDGGLKKYDEYKKQDSEHLLETTGKQLRKLMSWVDEKQA